MDWFKWLRPKRNPFYLDPARGRFCGWEKIRKGIEQTKDMLPEITSVAKRIAKIISKVVKVIGWALGEKYSSYVKLIGKSLEIILKLGSKIILGEITSDEAGIDLNKWLDEQGLDSSTVRNIIHVLAKIVTIKLEEAKSDSE